MGNFKEDIARTEAFVFDVDGVMTDGGIIPTLDGDFIRRYNAKDGYALAYAIKMGYKVCIITGGRGKTLENRLKMLSAGDSGDHTIFVLLHDDTRLNNELRSMLQIQNYLRSGTAGRITKYRTICDAKQEEVEELIAQAKPKGQ